MIKLKTLLENISDEYEFVGFHRQRRERGQYDDTFILGYGESHFRDILDALPFDDRDEAMRNGWIDYSWDAYDENYDKMEDEVSDWLNDKGYRWIFVTENRPIGVEAYGRFIYKIYFKKSDILEIFSDPMGADDTAYAYLYHIDNPPIAKIYDKT